MASVDQICHGREWEAFRTWGWLVRPWRGARRDPGAQALKTMRCLEQGPQESLRVVLESGAAFRKGVMGMSWVPSPPAFIGSWAALCPTLETEDRNSGGFDDITTSGL